jgi:hypothetical protein
VKSALVQAGCWLLMLGVLAVVAAYAWVGAETFGLTWPDIARQGTDLALKAVVAALLWFLYQRLRATPKRSSSTRP